MTISVKFVAEPGDNCPSLMSQYVSLEVGRGTDASQSFCETSFVRPVLVRPVEEALGARGTATPSSTVILLNKKPLDAWNTSLVQTEL